MGASNATLKCLQIMFRGQEIFPVHFFLFCFGLVYRPVAFLIFQSMEEILEEDRK